MNNRRMRECQDGRQTGMLQERLHRECQDEIGMKGGRKVNLGSIYREFMLSRQPDNSSGSSVEQLLRWNRITDSWVKAGRERDCIVMGDLNIDFMKWDRMTGINLGPCFCRKGVGLD